MSARTDAVKKSLRAGPGHKAVSRDKLLSTGSTTLNMAMTGDPRGGFFKGHYFFIVGDSNSGKTFLGWTCLAEATINPNFDNYRLIFDDVEGGSLMNLEKFFGRRVVERVEPPRLVNGQPVYSRTSEDFYYNLDDAHKDGRPFIYVLDSQDSLTSRAELKKFEKTKKAIRKSDSGEGDDEDKADAGKGSYTDSKAKVHSENLRKQMGPLLDSGSILIILNQTRDSFDMFVKSTYSGGRALVFYSQATLWFSIREKMHKTVNDIKREIGILAKVQVKRTRVTGREPVVMVPIYHSCGIDEMGGCVDYLADEGVWKESRGIITVTGLGPEFTTRREDLIRRIERDDLEDEVRELVVQCWREIDEKCRVERKFRYA